MSDLVNEMLGKFIALSQEEKQIAAKLDAAYKEYTDYCADSEKDLNKKIDEIHEKMDKLNYFVNYAREHANASELEDAAEPFDTPQGTLESIRQTIKLDSHNDPNAESLYTKATGKKLYYEQEIARTRQLIEGSKVQAKRQYDSDAAKLNKLKEEHLEKVRLYVQSRDFADYLKLLVYDKSAFNSPGTVTLNDDGHVSLGQHRVKLSVPMEMEQDVALSSNGEYNAAARTIGAPYRVSSKKGGTLFLEHDDRNGQYLLGGVQRLLLNFVKYFGEDITNVVFCDPDKFSTDCLGNISALGMGINPFITVPKSAEEIAGKVARFAAKAQSEPTPDKVSRILVMQNFPEKYSPDIVSKVTELCRNASSNGTLVILTHAVSAETTAAENEVRALAEVIRSRNGGFWIESVHESLFWYSAPSDISEEVRKKYVEKRRQDALNAAQQAEAEEPVMTAPAPAPVESPTPVREPVMTASAPAPAEAPAPVEEPTAPEPAADEAPMSAAAPKYDDEGLNSLSTSDDGEPIPAHILFSVPRPKGEEKEVTMELVSELSEQLPPPEPETPVFEMAPDFRPEQNIDPEYTYRITDKKPPKASEPKPAAEEYVSPYDRKLDPDMTYKITDHPPVKAPEPPAELEHEKRNVIKDAFDAGKRKIGAFVDNRKADIGSRKTSVPEYPAAFDMNAPAPAEEATTPVYGAPAADVTMDITETARIAEEQLDAAEAAPVEETPEPEEENIYGKGIRRLPEIPIGKNVEGVPVKMNISGNITYICGAQGSERKTLTDRAIAQITADTHPDDVELWLFDCGDGDFMKYADEPAAHIRYIVSDTGAETALDFADVIEEELKRRVEAFSENGWSGVGDIPADVFMPLIVVAVNAFPRFSENIIGSPKYFGRDHVSKLNKLFKNCSNYGIHFLLIGEEFSVAGECPLCLEGCTIHSAAVVSGKDAAAHKLFDGLKLYDNEIESLKRIPAGCAFTADVNSADGLTLVRVTGENAVNEHGYTAASEYSDNLEEYLEKFPFIVARKTASSFEERCEFRAEQVGNCAEGEKLLFIGEPCRFMGEYPVHLYDEFGENLMAIAPAGEKTGAARMVKAALRSLEEQGVKAEVLAFRSSPVYAELENSGELANVNVYVGDDCEARVKEISDMLEKGDRPEVFVIVLGGDLLVASMHANDIPAVLKRALVKGPRLGTHFMFVSGSTGAAAAGFLSLFRHRMVFACPYGEAEKMLRDPNCDLPENGFRLSNDYDELTMLPYLF